MTKQTVSTIESVKHGIVSTIKGAGDVSGALVDAVSKTVARTIEGVGGIATSLV